jgi:Fe-S-cluster containining protein
MEHNRTTCLRLHAGYACRHSGACCTAGWAIPVEGPRFERLRVYFSNRHAGKKLFATGGPLPEGAAAVLAVEASECVFFEPAGGRLCAVHRELGAEWLPDACRQFPRIVLQDARGTAISLSHYCPTAAQMLHAPEASAFDVIEAPPSLALHGDVEGLEARDALPPLLSPALLTDLDGYDAWERRAIGLLARTDSSADDGLDALEAATRRIQVWRPGGASLRDTVEREFDVASQGKPDEDLDGIVRRASLARRAVPRGLPCSPPVDDFRAGWPGVAAWWREREIDSTIRAYLAARLFGTWIAYYGRGLHEIVEYLRVALAVVKMEAVRQHPRHSPSSPWQTVTAAIRNADLLLVHLANARTLAQLLR